MGTTTRTSKVRAATPPAHAALYDHHADEPPGLKGTDQYERPMSQQALGLRHAPQGIRSAPPAPTEPTIRHEQGSRSEPDPAPTAVSPSAPLSGQLVPTRSSPRGANVALTRGLVPHFVGRGSVLGHALGHGRAQVGQRGEVLGRDRIGADVLRTSPSQQHPVAPAKGCDGTWAWCLAAGRELLCSARCKASGAARQLPRWALFPHDFRRATPRPVESSNSRSSPSGIGRSREAEIEA
jgi:hypothetical protein